jgi:hypothetical protein
MSIDLSPTEIVLGLAAGLTGAGYIAFILAPAWEAYDRLWERLAASFLTLFMLASLLGAGAGIGLAIVWSYDQYA